MIDLEDFKKSLGGVATELSVEDIQILRENQDKMAELFFASWSAGINKNKV